MAGMKFTLRTVTDATCPLGRKDMIVFDTVTRGFGLRVTSGGGKSFIAQYTTAAGKRRAAIGTFGVFTIEEARQRARAILGEAACGRDPVAEKREKARAAGSAKKLAGFTVRRLIDGWIEAREGDRRPSYLREARACLIRHLPEWLDRPAAQLTAAEVMDELDRIKKQKSAVAANRVLSYGRAAYGWGVMRLRVAVNPFRGIERPGREVSRERVLSKEELGAIWRACRVLSPTAGNLVRLLILTVGRRSEVAAMRWSELDNSDSPTTWTLPRERSKNNRAHVVSLSQPARQIIASQPRFLDNPFVFATSDRGHYVGFSVVKSRLVTALLADGVDVAEWRFHDFRRSGVSLLADAGVAPHICDRLLNHVGGAISGVASVYQRSEFAAERRAALDMWAEMVCSAANGPKTAGNVVRLPVGR